MFNTCNNFRFPGVPFQFSTVRNSPETIEVHWRGKECRSLSDDQWQESHLRQMKGVVGTEDAMYGRVYWEVEIFHKCNRSFRKDYACCMGICSGSKVDAVRELAKNYNFYGVTFGRGNNGQPLLIAAQRGKLTRLDFRPSTANYRNVSTVHLGFLFDSYKGRLVVVDVQSSKLCFLFEEVRCQGNCHDFIPAFYIDPVYNNDVHIWLKTGADIYKIPNCVKDYLK